MKNYCQSKAKLTYLTLSLPEKKCAFCTSGVKLTPVMILIL